MKYICTQEFYLDKYDDNGFLIENKYMRIPKDSIWEVDNNLFRIIGNNDIIHLDRIWKSKKARTWQWIEIAKETLELNFKNYIL